jgi:hypothetical protein
MIIRDDYASFMFTGRTCYGETQPYYKWYIIFEYERAAHDKLTRVLKIILHSLSNFICSERNYVP